MGARKVGRCAGKGVGVGLVMASLQERDDVTTWSGSGMQVSAEGVSSVPKPVMVNDQNGHGFSFPCMGSMSLIRFNREFPRRTEEKIPKADLSARSIGPQAVALQPIFTIRKLEDKVNESIYICTSRLNGSMAVSVVCFDLLMDEERSRWRK